MPRILVADDNSNIQKMVALALKDAGIDVVAVPNGEAAVRKLTDTTLDLVLADIFMPVRSGYEVCEFIKLDPRYSHLPVVLLVGAFDPLDEREAQRVGADGILKKPFVPPDPLINMVKSLLSKSSERLVTAAAPVAASATAKAPAEAAASYPPKVAADLPIPHSVVPHTHEDTHEDKPEAAPEPHPAMADFSDASPDEFAAPVGLLDFSDHEKPAAFGSLLDVPATDDRDLTVTASRDPVLGEPAFWASPAADDAQTDTDETSEDEDLQEHSWSTHSKPFPLAAESTAFAGAGSEATVSSNFPAKGFGIDSDLDEAAAGNGIKSAPLAEPEIASPFDAGAAHVPSDKLEQDDLSANSAADHVQDLRDAAMEIFSLPPTQYAGDEHPMESATSFAAPATDIESPAAEYSFSDLTAISEDASAVPAVEPAPASAQPINEPAIDPTIELATEPPATPAPSQLTSEPPKALEIPAIVEAVALPIQVAPEAEPEASIDTQKIAALDAPHDAESAPSEPVTAEPAEPESSAPESVTPANPEPTIDEIPAWMATASTIFARTEFEDAAIAELKSLSSSHSATPEAPADEAHAEPAHTEFAERAEHEEQAKREYEPSREEPAAPAVFSARAKHEALGEPAEISEPSLLTSEWPPAFTPKFSDAGLFEPDTAPSPARIFDIPARSARPDHAPAAPVAESRPDSAALDVSSLAGVGSAPISGMQSPEMVEAIVTRIVARMQPQVIDVVTREILRPIVEALVRRELDKH